MNEYSEAARLSLAELNKQTLRNSYANVWHSDDPSYAPYLTSEASNYRQHIEDLQTNESSATSSPNEILSSA